MNADVIIIGAGAIGTACAYFLSRRGVKVLVLERHHLCAGASGATASMISFGGTSNTPEALRPLNIESHRLIKELEKDVDKPLEMIHGGTLYVAKSEPEVREIQPFYEDLHERGIDCEFLNGPEARQFEPLLGPSVAGAVYNPVNYHVNPYRLCEGYLSAALHRNGRVEYGVRVHEVKVRDGKIDRVVTDKGDYHADRVVVASGAHTPQILSAFDIEIPIVPARGQVIVTEACASMTHRTLIFLDHLYLKQTASGNFYIGSHTEFVGFENRITLDKIAIYTQALFKAVPVLGRIRALRFFVGFRPICTDNLPIIGPVPDCPRLIIASGHGRSGMCYSAVTGKLVSELIADGKTGLPIDAFSVDRFSEKNL